VALGLSIGLPIKGSIKG